MGIGLILLAALFICTLSGVIMPLGIFVTVEVIVGNFTCHTYECVAMYDEDIHTRIVYLFYKGMYLFVANKRLINCCW